MAAPPAGRTALVVGLAGSALAAVGDLLILGRPVSGRDFDRATGLVPEDLTSGDRWRSLWNGVPLAAGRIRLGTLIGIGGVGLLAAGGLGGAARALPSGPLHDLAVASVAVFAVAGASTHHRCAAGVLTRRQLGAGERSEDHDRPRPPEGLLAVSAAATLGSLAVLSLVLTEATRRSGAGWWRAALRTPFPWVAAALATTGRLPAPVGGFLRPASISCGLLLSLVARGCRSPASLG